MIQALSIILSCQLAGEALGRSLGLPIPGPVLGMVLLVGLLSVVPGLPDRLRPVTSGFLAHLSLLFVPAGVGVVGHSQALGAHGLGIMVAIVGSTALAIAAGAVTFAAVARWSGSPDDEGDEP